MTTLFYSLVPAGLLVPAILVATAATVIASQALISGTFSLIAQGIVHNVSPHFRIIHTSYHHEGHIYVPMANWALLVGCTALVLTFRSSTNLGSAYGFAVTGVMFATSVAMILVSRYIWRWSWFLTVGVFGLFALLDLAFLISNSLKFVEGGLRTIGHRPDPVRGDAYLELGPAVHRPRVIPISSAAGHSHGSSISNAGCGQRAARSPTRWDEWWRSTVPSSSCGAHPMIT